MRIKGFTLVELLGVIIILGLLIVLAYPKLVNLVNNSSSKTDAATLNILYDATSLYLQDHEERYDKRNGFVYCISLQTLVNDGYLKDQVKLSSSASNLTSTKSVEASYSDGFTYELKDNNSCVSKGYKNYKNGEVVYYDVRLGTSCTNYHEDNSKAGYNGMLGTKTTDNQNGCLKFYSFNDDGGNRLNLILDHNTTRLISWNLSKSNTLGPKEVLEQLKIDTDDWNGTEIPTNYSIDQSSTTSQAKYTVDYSDYKARLITAQEIAKITNNTSWNEETSTNNYYFDSLSTSACTSGLAGGCKYGWLYDRTSLSCTSYSCLNNSDQSLSGYWTISSFAGDSKSSWSVHYNGVVSSHSVYDVSVYGIRPVIEVFKQNIE